MCKKQEWKSIYLKYNIIDFIKIIGFKYFLKGITYKDDGIHLKCMCIYTNKIYEKKLHTWYNGTYTDQIYEYACTSPIFIS
jgi:hypothetical protein